ncbi:MAG: hypothetical protein AAFR79_11410 [Pseudomonadota bacterium]
MTPDEMTPEQREAYELARERIAQAKASGATMLSLSSFQAPGRAVDPLWTGDPRFANLTTLPPEIADLSELRFLDLFDTQVSDLSPIAELSSLGWLAIGGSAVSDLSPLAGLKSLQTLLISHTKVADLSPLVGLDALHDITFWDIPACEAEPELKEISEIKDDTERTERLKAWLRERYTPEPPRDRSGAPGFVAGQAPPVRLLDPSMEGDEDQAELHDECRIKAEALMQVAGLGGNAAPRLSGTVDRYRTRIRRAPDEIGARLIWSIANTLESIWEVHQNAVKEGRASEELPPEVASALEDLLQTHRLWFLGHPDARTVWEDLRDPTPGADDAAKRVAAIGVVEAAEGSNAVDPAATEPARETIETSAGTSPAALRALKALDDWAYNLVATIARAAWKIAKDPPGGFLTHTVAGYYLIEFIIANEPVLAHYATHFMSQGPIWWEALMAMIRRAISPRPKG